MLTLNNIRARSTEARGRKQRFQAWQSPTWEDIDFLLSLLDSEAAGDPSHCALCEDPGFIYRDCVLAAATSMRSLCVEQMQTWANERRRDTSDPTRMIKYDTARDLMVEIQSLTLEQEQK